MELDDLKNTWKQADNVGLSKNQNIRELIQHKSSGPVAQLKRSFKWQMIAMTIVPIAILGTNMHHIDQTLSSALFWSYVLFCVGVIWFAWLNYRVVERMEEMDGAVRTNLERQIFLLETRLKQSLIGIRVALLFFILLTEMLPYFQYFKMLNTWHSLSPFIRFGAYAALFLFQYFVSRRVSEQRFGKHLANLKELVNQMR